MLGVKQLNVCVWSHAICGAQIKSVFRFEIATTDASGADITRIVTVDLKEAPGWVLCICVMCFQWVSCYGVFRTSGSLEEGDSKKKPTTTFIMKGVYMWHSVALRLVLMCAVHVYRQRLSRSWW